MPRDRACFVETRLDTGCGCDAVSNQERPHSWGRSLSRRCPTPVLSAVAGRRSGWGPKPAWTSTLLINALLSAHHHPMGGSRPMAFLGYPRGHRIDPETRCCMQQHTERLMSAWILSLEPEHRRTRWPPPRHQNLGDHLSSVRRSSCLWLQLFCVETFLLLPECQSNGRDLAG